MVERRPHHDVVQLPQRIQRRPRRDWLLVMHRVVTQLADQIHLRRVANPNLGFEPRIIDPGGQITHIWNR